MEKMILECSSPILPRWTLVLWVCIAKIGITGPLASMSSKVFRTEHGGFCRMYLVFFCLRCACASSLFPAVVIGLERSNPPSCPVRPRESP